MAKTSRKSKSTGPRWPRLFPLYGIALPAVVATFSGWVGLGQMAGFGSLSFTLPVGVEAYSLYAMTAWLSTAPLSSRTRLFAKTSAMMSLGVGMLGQIMYHVLKAQGVEHAPESVTAFVSVLPVLVIGLAGYLAHLLAHDRTEHEEKEARKAARKLAKAQVADLSALKSDAARVREALKVLGTDASAENIIRWMQETGVEYGSESAVRSAHRKYATLTG